MSRISDFFRSSTRHEKAQLIPNVLVLTCLIHCLLGIVSEFSGTRGSKIQWIISRLATVTKPFQFADIIDAYKHNEILIVSI